MYDYKMKVGGYIIITTKVDDKRVVFIMNEKTNKQILIEDAESVQELYDLIEWHANNTLTFINKVEQHILK